MIFVSKIWFFDPKFGRFKHFDLACACEAKSMLVKELDANLKMKLNENYIYILDFLFCSFFFTPRI
jgi:hypothetical protein